MCIFLYFVNQYFTFLQLFPIKKLIENQYCSASTSAPSMTPIALLTSALTDDEVQMVRTGHSYCRADNENIYYQAYCRYYPTSPSHPIPGWRDTSTSSNAVEQSIRAQLFLRPRGRRILCISVDGLYLLKKLGSSFF